MAKCSVPIVFGSTIRAIDVLQEWHVERGGLLLLYRDLSYMIHLGARASLVVLDT
jgi:hypothetical protein